MIPHHLRIAGFLSYRDPVELDFTTFDLACISGHNGAGKSSLLDAITWALFGVARGRQESVINLQSSQAEVVFTFELEGNTYRVQRLLRREKPLALELQILDPGNPAPRWRPLTERSVRETQDRLESLLRMDYDTFVNTSFFIQGKADQFTQQTAAKRKEVLASVLGLEVWETYRERAAGRRRRLEDQLAQMDGALQEIEQELGEEQTRKQALAQAEQELGRATAARQKQEELVNLLRQSHHRLDEQRQRLEMLRQELERLYARRDELRTKRLDDERKRQDYQHILARQDEIEAAYHRWRELRAQLDSLETQSQRYRELEERRRPYLDQITAERAGLEERQKQLQQQESNLQDEAAQLPTWEAEIHSLKDQLERAESELQRLQNTAENIQRLRQEEAELRSENQHLKAQMDELKQRIDRLSQAQAACPLCGQPLSDEHRSHTVSELQAQGEALGKRYRQNAARIQEIQAEIAALSAPQSRKSALEAQIRELTTRLATLTTRRDDLQQRLQEWEAQGRPQLNEITRLLSEETFAAAARQQLAALDNELRTLGYDPQFHQAQREAWQQLQQAEEDYRALQEARKDLQALDERLAERLKEEQQLEAEISQRDATLHAQEEELQRQQAALPPIQNAEEELLRLQEAENRAQLEVGARRQQVEALEVARQRAAQYRAEKERLRSQIAHYVALERAFGKNGVPALLIEQALPQIEARANEILDRLTNGTMSLRFETQVEYKDKRREDRKETLEIRISDASGVRPYEMYSGGEAFRINFALRLALAQVLAQRKGARLQTLIIDEGFGSQDPQGRQRLIEAINLIRHEFAKILVITHLEELKDAFPTRIEVEKGERGSTLRVI